MASLPGIVLEDVNSLVSSQLATRQYCYIGGDSLREALDVSVRDINIFSRCWNDLQRDTYMADGGTYRYRRYGQFKKRAGSGLSLLPHAPYIQSSEINALNGGIQRHFAPLSDDFSSAILLKRLLHFMSEVYDDVEGTARDWTIRLHPYRIYADACQIGKPTPEGLHRDGVTYIASLMIKRQNIMGGRTRLTDVHKNTLNEICLEKPLDIIVSDDEKTLHEVSMVSPEVLGEVAYRDVLVIAFTKEN